MLVELGCNRRLGGMQVLPLLVRCVWNGDPLYIDELIETIREEGPETGVWATGEIHAPTGEPPLIVSLYRFQSYRARTQSALKQEIEDYIVEAGLSQLHWKVLAGSAQVILW